MAGSCALLALLGLIPALDAAIAFVNRAATRGFGATILPGLALREGVPPQLRTLVAVPTLLTTPEAIEEVIERLEIHYLASPEGDLHFALLSDWVDAATEHTAADEALLETAGRGIARLNQTVCARLRRATASCCCTAGGSGATCSNSGWDGNASAASSTS